VAAASGDGGPAAEQAAAGVDPAPAAAANAAVANAAAAGSAVGDTAPTDSVDSDDEEQGPWAGRPVGCKAAKRARADNIADDRTIGRVVSAFEKLGDATTQRTAMMAFSLPFMGTKPEDAASWAPQAKKMLATERIKVKASKPASDSSAAADGEANKTSKDKVVAPPPLGNVDDIYAIDDSSATGNAAAEEDVTVVGDTRSIVPPPVATPEVVEELRTRRGRRCRRHRQPQHRRQQQRRPPMRLCRRQRRHHQCSRQTLHRRIPCRLRVQLGHLPTSGAAVERRQRSDSKRPRPCPRRCRRRST